MLKLDSLRVLGGIATTAAAAAAAIAAASTSTSASASFVCNNDYRTNGTRHRNGRRCTGHCKCSRCSCRGEHHGWDGQNGKHDSKPSRWAKVRLRKRTRKRRDGQDKHHPQKRAAHCQPRPLCGCRVRSQSSWEMCHATATKINKGWVLHFPHDKT